MLRKTLILSLALCLPLAHAQQAPASPAAAVKTNGTALIIPAVGEVRMANDEARLVFAVEEQDKDQAAAASRANRKMKEGIDLMKRLDPQASLATQGYHTYPVYAEDDGRSPAKVRKPVAWRVRQSLEVTTTNLDSLPQTVAGAQEKLALQGLHFGLSDASRRKLDRQVMEEAYRHLNQRIEAAALVMGRRASEAQLEQVDFGGGEIIRPYAVNRMEMAMKSDTRAVETPQFEPGETPVQMQIVARVRFP